MEINYNLCIKLAYPEITDEEFSLKSDESGLSIATWHDYKYGPAPTFEYLETFWLQAVRNIKKAEIKATRDSEINDGVSGYTTRSLTNNFTINSSRADLDNMKNLRDYMDAMIKQTLAAQGVTDATMLDQLEDAQQITIRDFNNNDQTITMEELERLVLELQAWGLWLFQRKWVKDLEIDAATTVDDVLAITFF